ncbi:MAG: hypothetical protein CSB48_09070 [Proteobacteria bacterium]|nr:MAG: hypothetical protein CSB48_09070 [Pseudomonadota bacterium]
MTEDAPAIPAANAVDNNPGRHTRIFTKKRKNHSLRQTQWDGQERRRSDRRSLKQSRGPMIESRAGVDRRRKNHFYVKI